VRNSVAGDVPFKTTEAPVEVSLLFRKVLALSSQRTLSLATAIVNFVCIDDPVYSKTSISGSD